MVIIDVLTGLENDKEAIQVFVDAIEAKDPYTQGHSHHVSAIVKSIYDCLPETFRKKLDKEKLITAALLHDVGKIMTPDSILNKEGALNEDEWFIMRQHPLNSRKIVEGTPFEYMGDWILYHHERMDGRGYYGLSGDRIPVESRIIAIADTFSALRTYRVYRPAKSIEETVRIMSECAGTQLDTEILSCFLSLDTDFLEKLECNCEICRQRRLALESKAIGV